MVDSLMQAPANRTRPPTAIRPPTIANGERKAATTEGFRNRPPEGIPAYKVKDYAQSATNMR